MLPRWLAPDAQHWHGGRLVSLYVQREDADDEELPQVPVDKDSDDDQELVENNQDNAPAIKPEPRDFRIYASYMNPQPVALWFEMLIWRRFNEEGINVWDGLHWVEYDTVL